MHALPSWLRPYFVQTAAASRTFRSRALRRYFGLFIHFETVTAEAEQYISFPSWPVFFTLSGNVTVSNWCSATWDLNQFLVTNYLENSLSSQYVTLHLQVVALNGWHLIWTWAERHYLCDTDLFVNSVLTEVFLFMFGCIAVVKSSWCDDTQLTTSVFWDSKQATKLCLVKWFGVYFILGAL